MTRRTLALGGPELYGWETLGQDDAWWRLRWAQTPSTEELADRCGVPQEDVRERLRQAGVELRGRPPEGQRELFDLPPPVPAVFTLLVDGAAVETQATTWRQACAQVWATAGATPWEAGAGAAPRVRVVQRRKA